MPDQREKAIELMQQQRFDEALAIFLRLIETSANDWSLYYLAGQCYRFSRRLPEAVRVLRRAASLNANEPQVFLALGIAQQLSGSYELAIEALEQAIQLDPHLFSAYNSIGLTYRKMGNFRKALEWYDRAVEGTVGAATEKAQVDRERCFREEIIEGKKALVVLPYMWERTHELLRSDPTYAVLKNNIGVCLLQLGEVDSARKQFLESIEFIPDGYEYPEPYKNLESMG